MKTLGVLVFLLGYNTSLIAQKVLVNENRSDVFVDDTTQHPHTSGYWLIRLKQPSNFSSLSKAGFRIQRQLSATEFIVRNVIAKPVNDKIQNALPANSNWKYSPQLLMDSRKEDAQNNILEFQLQFSNPDSIKRFIQSAHPGVEITGEYENVLQLKTTFEILHQRISSNEAVNFIGLANRHAKEETKITGFDNSSNRINKLHNVYPLLNGNGIVVSVKENKPDTNDIDFKGRFLTTVNSSNTLSSHATIMSTLIAGAGNSSYTSKGVAWGGTLSSSNFAVLLPDNDSYYQQNQIVVQNHSYGTTIENFYGADAAAYDASVNNNTSLLHVFSAGNAGNLGSTDGVYKNIVGFGNLTGSFKMAKNIITVGSVDSFYAIPLLSSKGPAYDGRIKPELVAFGEDGSSGAAALVSGSALVLQQSYKDQNNNAAADASLIKAVLLNSADDVGPKGIDFISGYGNLNAYRAEQDMQKNQFFTGTISNGQTQSFDLTIPANTKNLKLMLCWTDKPAPANAFTALINDLDITLTQVATGQTWRPWVLNSTADIDSLKLLPLRKRDSLNTTEQITIEDPLPGNYRIAINGFDIPSGFQKYYVAYQWDSANQFEWTYPVSIDNLLPHNQHIMRWQTNQQSAGTIAYKYAGANQWQTFDSLTNISVGYSKWLTPDTNAVAQLRLSVSGLVYISDTFTISSSLQTGVGFNCPDSVLLYWNKGATGNYRLFKLGDRYLEPVSTLPDTAIILNKISNPAKWYSLAPLLSFNKTGIKSDAFNYEDQGVGCYLKSFTADLSNNTAVIKLELGTSYQVATISIEKIAAPVVQTLQTFNTTGSLQYNTSDAQLNRGLNIYRAKIVLKNGKIIYSDNQPVYYFNKSNYIIYPNPVQQQQYINIISAELNNPTLQVFNAYGQKLLDKKLYNLVEQVPASMFGKGIYFFIIWKDGKKDSTGKLIIQ